MTQQLPFRMIEDELDPQQIIPEIMNIINQWLADEHIKQNAVQKEMLLSHVQAMVHRAKTLEQLPDVDPTLFAELSAESMELAKRTIKLFNNLPMEEAYLLAVHYEVAKANAE
ncbi:transcriptional antiterminator [Orbus mooreae]|uniref:transcriptional antiterminator n=1 Tax=Orbus mooreae TaxID=3074107 RepID=UPI00370D8A02